LWDRTRMRRRRRCDLVSFLTCYSFSFSNGIPDRYMYEKLGERSEILDDRIDEFAIIVKEYYNISEIGDPSALTDVCSSFHLRIVRS
jgi:hypothetical protein